MIRLNQARERNILTAVLDSVREPAAIIGLEREIVAANSLYSARYSREPSSSQLHCFEVNHGYSGPCSRQTELCPIQLSSESGNPCWVQHTHLGFHGKNQEMSTVHPVLDSKGETTAYLQILRSAGFQDPLNLTLWASDSLTNKKMLRSIKSLAGINGPVLIKGEAGSGKELVARTLHRMSRQRKKDFVPMDCTGLSEKSFLRLLFGQEIPAHPDALIRRGLLEVAQGGILFLHEVGDIGLSPQVMLLVLIETGFFRRSGGSKPHSTNVRLICSTHCDLEQKVEKRLFNRDLFNLISRHSITVPPLRKRLQDLPDLVGNLLHHLSCGRIISISPSALTVLQHHSFPGNIRELISILEYACLSADGSTILPEHLPPEF